MQEKTTKSPPLVALIGRPNVGKSTLFNRLVGKKLAITDSIPGSTRDIIERTITLDDRFIRLADTGGRRDEATSTLEQLAVERSYTIDDQADLLLFVLEAQQILPEDEQLISYLRKYHHKVLLVVNKCDSRDRDLIAQNYHTLGFKEIIMVSAEHGRNIDLLKERILDYLPPVDQDTEQQELQAQEQQPIRLTILGKPNAGKSSLTNALSESDASLVSSQAGTTRDSVKSRFTYQDQLYELIDTAGLRKRAKVNDPIEFYSTRRAEASIKEADVVLLMIDAGEGLSDQDKKIADKIMEEQKPFLFVLNKCDLLATHDHYKTQKGDKVKLAIQDLRDAFPIFSSLAVVPIEAKHANGLDKLMKMVKQVYQQSRKLISDAEFQRAMLHWRHDLQSASVYQKSSLKSIRQVGVQPPKFEVRVQGRKPVHYVRHIHNRIQKEFGFNLVPIIVEVEGV